MVVVGLLGGRPRERPRERWKANVLATGSEEVETRVMVVLVKERGAMDLVGVGASLAPAAEAMLASLRGGWQSV